MANVIQNAIYKHYKGGEYVVIGVSVCEETSTRYVVYAKAENPNEIWYHRPLDEFYAKFTLADTNTPLKGTPLEAIEFALSLYAPLEAIKFLTDWLICDCARWEEYQSLLNRKKELTNV